MIFRNVRAIAQGSVLAFGLGAAQVAFAAPPSFTEEQAQAGRSAYDTHCSRCHGGKLDDGRFGMPLVGKMFTEHWAGKPASEYLDKAMKNMPPGMIGSVDPVSMRNIVAFILQANGVQPGKVALPADTRALAEMILPASSNAQVAQAAPARPPAAANAPAAATPDPERPRVAVAEAPPAEVPALLKAMQPVTDEMLRAPSDGDWLLWRRTYDSQGFSPLKQITARNVKDVEFAWSWTLAAGAMESTPLIHDGVMFIQSGMDVVQALDAATGDLLWTYMRTAPGAPGKNMPKRNMAIYGTTILVGTADVHMIALDARTGALLWDRLLGDVAHGGDLTSGPVVAKGKVFQGIVGGSREGETSGAIVAMDINTGSELWRFKTIPGPGEPGGDTWNDLPANVRSGGNVWAAGSYDPDLDLLFFGTGNYYQIDLVRKKVRPDANMDLLYTNTTLALNPDTGKLVWHFQHLPNDLFNMDWAFERTILNVNGQKVVMSGGKMALFDAVEAATGKYAFSHDLGLQTIVTRVDPETGAKTINPALAPEDGRERMTCPSGYGARNWMPTSYDAARNVLYIPLLENCNIQKGPNAIYAPVAPSATANGKFGHLAALDIKTGKVLWRERVRHSQSSGVLATAGGVLFNTDVNRWLRANDARTGAELWKARLSDAANAHVISYAVKGKQYVAVAAGGRHVTMGTLAQMTPEVKLPPSSTPTVWVFALPD